MLTNNCKKLLRSTIEGITSGSNHYGVITSISGAFVMHNDNSTNQILNSSETSDEIARIRCSSVVAPFAFGWHGFGLLDYVKKSALPTNAYSASGHTYIVCTYDSKDSPITPELVNVPGDDVVDASQAVSVTKQNNYVVTITFNNASADVMHINRIGVYMPVQTYPAAAGAGGCMLIHVLAIDDIALAPGETKSITIQPDLD